MPTVYVYAPLSGKITQCNDNYHCPCTDSSDPNRCVYSSLKPIDISAVGGTAIKLYVNYPYIKSISWEEDTGGGSFECCDGESTPTDLKRAVRVYLYADYNHACLVGWVLFGHVDEDGRNLPNGNISQKEAGVVGKVSSGSGYDCYGGAHLHMEVGILEISGSCFVTKDLTGGTTAVYTKTYSTCPA